MKMLPTLIAAVFVAVTYSALAADAAPAKMEAKAEAAAPKKMTAQQEKMKFCNKEAKEKTLKGTERKAFMKSCLKKDGASVGKMAAASKPSKKSMKAAETAPAAQ